MIEPYQWLCAHASTLGLSYAAIGPASADLGLSGFLKEWRPMSQTLDPVYTAHNPMMGDRLSLRPGCFYLACAIEIIHVPPTHAAMIHMRSSLARRGLGHKMAGFIDPGFHGQVTLELETSIPLEVTIGERIVQITYHRLMEPTTEPYRGHYLGQRGPTEAYAVVKETSWPDMCMSM